MNNETNKAVSAEGSGVRRYSVEENYSEVIEDGATWVRASDHDAAIATLSAERDAWEKQCIENGKLYAQNNEALLTERDALTARVAQLEEALRRLLPSVARAAESKPLSEWEMAYQQANAALRGAP